MPFSLDKESLADTYMAATAAASAGIKDSLSLQSVTSKIPRRKNQSVASAIMQLTLAAATVLFLTGTLAHPGGLFDLVRLPPPKPSTSVQEAVTTFVPAPVAAPKQTDPSYNPTWKGNLDHFYDNSDEYVHPSQPATWILPGFKGVMTELPFHSECVNSGPATMGAMKSIFVPKGFTCAFFALPNCNMSDAKVRLYSATADNIKDGSGNYHSSALCHLNNQVDDSSRGVGAA